MTLRETLRGLSAATVAAVLALHARHEQGQLDREALIAAVAAVIARADSRAVALADLALAADVTRALQRPVATLGLTVAADTGTRLLTAARTATERPETAAMRLARLAENEPLERAAEARAEGIRRSRHVTGWKRQAHGGCPACMELASRDVTLNPRTPMWRHTGCSCTQLITTRRKSA